MDEKEIKKITDEIINQIDKVRINLSDEFYPDNLFVLETLREDIEEILIKKLKAKRCTPDVIKK